MRSTSACARSCSRRRARGARASCFRSTPSWRRRSTTPRPRAKCRSRDIPEDWVGVDIGPKTVDLFKAQIATARTIFWNGPMGIFEKPSFAEGTRAVARAIADATGRGASTIVGGGDSVAAVQPDGHREPVHAHFDRRRRLARVHGRAFAARRGRVVRRGRSGRLADRNAPHVATQTHRRELEDEQDHRAKRWPSFLRWARRYPVSPQSTWPYFPRSFACVPSPMR